MHGNNISKSEYSRLISARKVSIFLFNLYHSLGSHSDIRNALIHSSTLDVRHSNCQTSFSHTFAIYLLSCIPFHFNRPINWWVLFRWIVEKLSDHPTPSKQSQTNKYNIEKLCRNGTWTVLDITNNEQRTTNQMNAPKIFTSGNLISKIDAISWFCWCPCSRQHDNFVFEMKSFVLPIVLAFTAFLTADGPFVFG